MCSTPVRNKLIIFVSIAFLSSNASSQGDWTLEKSEAGIKVYTRAIAGSQYRSFKAIATIRAPFDAVECIIRNTDSYAKWFAYTKRAELLTETHNEKLVYIETTFPWPFSNEDMIYKISFPPGKSEMKIVLRGVPDYRPPVNGVNRMHGANGYLQLINHGDATEVIYAMHSELGGNIPAWLANQNIYELPLKTLTNLRGMAEKRCQ